MAGTGMVEWEGNEPGADEYCYGEDYDKYYGVRMPSDFLSKEERDALNGPVIVRKLKEEAK